MPRRARVVIAGCAHHVTQRGNDGQVVFRSDEDREVFLARLREASERFGLTVEGYCLMSNHVHLIATPKEKTSLAQALKRTGQLYAQYVNRRYNRRGHLWQDRFFSCALDDAHLWRALAYVERNPVRARLCRKAWRWAWSSAAAHCGGRDGSSLLDLEAWAKQIDLEWWKDELTASEDATEMRQFRLCTSRNRPWADEAILRKWESDLAMRLRPLPPGRPRRTEKEHDKTGVRP